MNKKILFYGSNLLYFKSLLPIICELQNKKKLKIYIHTNTSNFLSKLLFNKNKLKRPQQVNMISEFTISWVAKLINKEKKFNLIKNKINFLKDSDFIFKKFKFDDLICTTKDLNEIKKFKKNYENLIILGYHHMPFVISNKTIKKIKNKNEDFFLKKNFFTKVHDLSFSKIIGNFNFFLNRFVYLEKKYNFKKNLNYRKVLIFHPGGYRDIFTKEGDSKQRSYEVQSNFIDRVCLPLIKNKLTPVIKIHPLHAKFHGIADIKNILKEKEINQVKLIGPEKQYFKELKNCKFVISFGSSSSYELWSLNYKNIFYCNFYGKIRTDKFKFLKKQFFCSNNDFSKIIKSKNFNEFFSKDYSKLFKLYSNLKSDGKKITDLIVS